MLSTLFLNPVSRIAPTPSGFLHEGNAFSFILTWLYVRANKGSLRLRIDDMDTERSRPEYLADIFRSLDWLGLDWDLGPTSVDEHQRLYVQHGFIDLYMETLGILKEKTLLFPCSCSRKGLEGVAGYPGACLKKQKQKQKEKQKERQEIEPKPYALRLKTLPETDMEWKDEKHIVHKREMPEEMKHTILQRKDGLPSYQLVSLVDDIRHGVNFIVRGDDLLPSTLFQLHLANSLGDTSFSNTRFLHHTLLKEGGEKLSKSRGSFALFQLKEKEKSPAQLYRRFGEWMNFTGRIESATEALQLFRETRMKE